jgi:lysozyme
MTLIEELRKDEGLRLTPYRDSEGVLTIGYGTNIENISIEEAEFLLQHRVALAAKDLMIFLPWASQLDPARYNVLHNMVYNMGISRLMQFHNTLAAVQVGNWQAAKDGMLASLWAKQVGPRAVRLAETMLTGGDT